MEIIVPITLKLKAIIVLPEILLNILTKHKITETLFHILIKNITVE